MTQMPATEELKEIMHTACGGLAADDQMATRLQFVADLLASLGGNLTGPNLAWREPGSGCQTLPLQHELVVGRQAGPDGLTLAGDDRLSRRHFVIRAGPEGWSLQNLQSRNGTALNRSDAAVEQAALHDGDLIFAGRHILAFLNPESSGATRTGPPSGPPPAV